jgi:hypothetical protein
MVITPLVLQATVMVALTPPVSSVLNVEKVGSIAKLPVVPAVNEPLPLS